MSADDEYNEFEIETVAAIISAERAEQCEDENYDFDEYEGDYYDHHHHSGGCAILIALFTGTAALIMQVLFSH